MSTSASSLGPAQPSLFDRAIAPAPKPAEKTARKPARRALAPTLPGFLQGDAARKPAKARSGRVKLMDLRQQWLLSARARVVFLLMAFAALALVALVQIAWLGMSGASPSSRPTATALVPDRGEITDRNGVPLARAYPAYSLYFYPKAMGSGADDPLVKSPEDVTKELLGIFPHMNKERTLRLLKSGKSGVLRRKILPEEANQVWSIGEPSVQTPRSPDRHYPQGKLAAHVLGRVLENDEGKKVGAFGMEQALEAQLSDPVARAQPAALSIDVRVQGALEDEMGRGMLASGAKGAAGIVLDVDTGEVLAMASLPDFDPNRISFEDKDNTGNRVSFLTGELGSTFKPLTVAAAIDSGVVRDLRKSWNAAPVTVAGKTYEDSDFKGASLNIPQALAYSSNTVTMRVARELGGERLRQVMIDLGMNRAPNIELQARGTPYWPSGKWSPQTTMTVGFGHALTVTPLHLANAYAAMVNGGIYRDATLLKVEPGQADPGRRVFKASTSHRMRQMLRMVAIYGTGKGANAPGFRVGGKTGTAEKLINGRYSQSKMLTTFASAFPMDRPRYVVVVTLDEPTFTEAMRGRTAAFNAAPIVGNLIRRAGPMLGVRPDNTRDVDISDLQNLMGKGE
ncbi:MAG: penicillin-binding protein 2 [Pseudomonadota bacterium]|nr:penicillin-binding protein 2 [Pseudomonadota bacterium]